MSERPDPYDPISVFTRRVERWEAAVRRHRRLQHLKLLSAVTSALLMVSALTVAIWSSRHGWDGKVVFHSLFWPGLVLALIYPVDAIIRAIQRDIGQSRVDPVLELEKARNDYDRRIEKEIDHA